jgi:hypothetical protein
MKRSAGGVIWVLIWIFLAAPWLAWVAFHPVADARFAWALVAHPRQGGVAVMEALHNAYDVPPFSYTLDAEGRFQPRRPLDAARRHCTSERTLARRAGQSRCERSHSLPHATGGGRCPR